MAGSAGRDYGDRAFHRACLLGDRTILWAYTSIGFWLVGGLLTLIYAAVFGLLAYFISEHDPIWGRVIFGLVFLMVGALHLRARDN